MQHDLGLWAVSERVAELVDIFLPTTAAYSCIVVVVYQG
jgi:hypothetical protein